MTSFTRFMIGMILGVALLCVTTAWTSPHETDVNHDSSSDTLLFFLSFHSTASDLPFTPEQRTVVPITVRSLEKISGRISFERLFVRPTHFAFDHLSHRLGSSLFCPNPLSEPLYLAHSVLLI